jgi:hypothetical protein
MVMAGVLVVSSGKSVRADVDTVGLTVTPATALVVPVRSGAGYVIG